MEIVPLEQRDKTHLQIVLGICIVQHENAEIICMEVKLRAPLCHLLRSNAYIGADLRSKLHVDKDYTQKLLLPDRFLQINSTFLGFAPYHVGILSFFVEAALLSIFLFQKNAETLSQPVGACTQIRPLR